jgi:hypothetical protein
MSFRRMPTASRWINSSCRACSACVLSASYRTAQAARSVSSVTVSRSLPASSSWSNARSSFAAVRPRAAAISLLRRGSGLFDAPGRRVVGAKGENRHCLPFYEAPRVNVSCTWLRPVSFASIVITGSWRAGHPSAKFGQGDGRCARDVGCRSVRGSRKGLSQTAYAARRGVTQQVVSKQAVRGRIRLLPATERIRR